MGPGKKSQINNMKEMTQFQPTIPLTLAEVTPAWLSSVISKEVSPKNFQVTDNVQEGTGFFSHLLRISCEVETTLQKGATDEAESAEKQLNLIVKLLPVVGQTELSWLARQLIIEGNFDVTELKFYEIVQRDLVQELEELSAYLCPYHCGFIIKEPRDSIIVLEDLKPQGYYTLNFGQKVSIPRVQESVRFISKFHYAGSAVEFKRKTPLSILYPFLQRIPDAGKSVEDSSFFKTCLGAIDKLDGFFAAQNCSLEMRDDYKKILPIQFEVTKNIFTKMYNCPSMIHDDLWSNNFLFTDNPKLTLKAIDWQFVGFGDAAYDLAVLIVTMLPAEELHLDNVEKLLKLYLDTFEEYCTRHGLENLITRSREEFSDFFFTYAMGYVFLRFTCSQGPFISDFPRLVHVYEFLRRDVNLIPFFLSLRS